MMIRFQFTKLGLAVCLSHLDTIRTLERACRRAKLPLAYSQGFNPRPRLAFGPALPVGTESLAEYFEAEMEGECSPAHAVRDLNRNLPVGLSVVDGWVIPSGSPALSAVFVAADYRVDLEEGTEQQLSEAIASILERDNWVIERSRKAAADVRSLVYGLELRMTEQGGQLWLSLALGSQGTLRPDDVLLALAQECQGCFDPQQVTVTRVRVLIKAIEGSLIPFGKNF